MWHRSGHGVWISGLSPRWWWIWPLHTPFVWRQPATCCGSRSSRGWWGQPRRLEERRFHCLSVGQTIVVWCKVKGVLLVITEEIVSSETRCVQEEIRSSGYPICVEGKVCNINSQGHIVYAVRQRCLDETWASGTSDACGGTRVPQTGCSVLFNRLLRAVRKAEYWSSMTVSRTNSWSSRPRPSKGRSKIATETITVLPIIIIF